MVSTRLFAPQVRSMQPAFIYNGEIKIYFSFSSYDDDTIVDKKIRYSLIDPNQTSTWGNNDKLKTVEGAQFDTISGLYYLETDISIDTSGITYFTISSNSNQRPALQVNQFYQMQLWAVNSDGLEVSAPSQPTLLRPINEPDIHFTGVSAGETLNTYDFSILTGYTTDNIETLDRCYCIVKDDDEIKEISWRNPEDIKVFGKNFSIPIDNNIVVEGVEYDIEFYYTTKHGYSNITPISFKVNYQAPSEDTSHLLSAQVDEMVAAITINIPNDVAGNMKIQKSINGNSWQTVKEQVTAADIKWNDHTIESDIKYFYRIVYDDVSNGKKMRKTNSSISTSFEDIYLSDENGMIAIKYNPSITNFKYVTQESIINTLGGKYPIIRKNGDTKYRQFNLSGTIFLDGYINTSDKIIHSGDTEINLNYNKDCKNALWVNNNTHLYDYLKSIPIDATYIREKRYKDIIMNLLTNGAPKLFRSFEEGNMIIYLSNISFTPNKQLSRHIYDFSATVTEICDYNEANLTKYNLNQNNYEDVVSLYPSAEVS